MSTPTDPPSNPSPGPTMHHVILDSGGIIKGQTNTYHKLGAKFWTISEVLGEIRDMKARERLEMLPVDLEVRTPSEKAMHAVSKFAKQTGDFAALSLVDLKVMALSYDLECQVNGVEFLRETPKRVSHAIPPKKVAGQQASKPAKVSSSPSIITDEEMANCVPCECDHDGDHTHHEVEHQDTAPVSVVIDNVQSTDDNVQSTDDKDANKEDVSVPQVPPPAGVDEVAEEIMAQLEDLDIAEQEAQEDYSDDDHEDDQDSQDEARHVSFEPEPKELEQVPPSFTSEDFPSLGGPVTKSQDVPPPAPTTNSWAKKISSEVLQPATSAQAFAAPRSTTNQVIASSAALSTSEHDHISHFESGPELTSTSTITSETNSGSDKKAIPSRILSGGVGGGYANSEWNARQSNEDDGIGWINPSNVDTCKNSGQNMLNSQAFEKVNADFKVVSSGKKKRGKKQQASEEPQVVRPFNVACMTTDYAMQNVMVQMGLQVLSTDCRLIQQVKQWVLRCGACFQVHYDMDRLFCSRCGSNLMQRISASTDSRTGELRLHLKKNYHYNTRGLIHSLPKAGKQKKYDGELLLREDQLMSGIWRQKVVKIRKDVRSAFGEDVTADVGMHINKGAAIKVGLGRRNPNADRGRERRGKKKK